ncbi:MAG: alanine racemase [Acidimicrobiia bacterium]|nr:alanine racemase [Acidimicrobiia bacterium]
MRIDQISTPALVIDQAAFEHNVATMSAVRPGASLRPHVKAFKSTDLARRLADAGHTNFCCATVREMEGMAAAGLGHDLLLANEVVDPRRLRRLGTLAEAGAARVTVAVDSVATIEAAARSGITDVLIDVFVGLPRCGCDPDDAEQLAEVARASGLHVRGVMGYEGHLVHEKDRGTRTERVAAAMADLARAHAVVGGDIVSGGGTGTYDCNDVVNEVQAGSYTLMDGQYGELDLPFRPALHVLTTVISVNPSGWVVLDGGLKALAMDQGNPTTTDATVLFCSDEHTVIAPDDGVVFAVGDRVMLAPAHIDPTIAKHPRMFVAAGDQIVDEWAVDLRDWGD